MSDAQRPAEGGGAEASCEMPSLTVEADEVDELRKTVAQLQSQLSHQITASKREQASLLKLVIAMATRQYGFDPRATRSRATAAIAGDLKLAGASLDEGTILKVLRQGAKLLDEDDTK
jgi:hypothetical protein